MRLREPQISEKTPVRFSSITAFWSAVVSLLVTGWIASASYNNILHRLDSMEGNYVKTSQLQRLLDNFRERNPTLSVPPLPASDQPAKRDSHHGEVLAVIAETHNRNGKYGYPAENQ